jgi:hypothetical protein
MQESLEITVIGSDGQEWVGRGRIVTTWVSGLTRADGSIRGVDLYDRLRTAGMRVRLEGGEEAPILVTHVDGDRALFAVRGAFERPDSRVRA